MVQGTGKLLHSFCAAFGCRSCLTRASPPSHSQVRLCFHFQCRQIWEFAFRVSLANAEPLHRVSPRASGRENRSSLGFRRGSFILPSALSREDKSAAIPGSQVCRERGHSCIGPSSGGQFAELVGIKALRDLEHCSHPKRKVGSCVITSSCVSCCLTQFPCC